MSQQNLSDTRTRAHGWPLAIIIALCLGAAIITWRAVVAATEAFVSGEYLMGVTSMLAALLWILGCAGIAHNGRRMRVVALVSCVLNLVGAGIGLASPDLFSRVNPWFEAGATYFYLPTIGAVIALGWLVWSRPAAVAARQVGESRS